MKNEAEKLKTKLRSTFNDHVFNEAFMEYVDYEIGVMGKALEKQVDPVSIYKTQGDIARLRKFRNLRDFVNGQ